MQLAEARIRIASPDALLRELRAAVGDAHVLSEPGDLLAYEYDASNITAVPDLAVLPGSAEEVAWVLRIAARELGRERYLIGECSFRISSLMQN